MGDRRTIARDPSPVAEPGRHPADGDERAGVGSIAGRHQHAASRLDESAELRDLLRSEPIQVGEYDDLLPSERVGPELLERDYPGNHLWRLVARRGQCGSQEVGLAVQGLRARLAVDEEHGDRRSDFDGDIRLVVAG